MAQTSSPQQLKAELQEETQEMKENSVTRLEEEQKPRNEPSAALEQIFAFLKARNDTQRFVGLTLLMRYLEGIQGQHELILRCWAAIPGPFLTRLLRAKATNRKDDAQSKEEAQIQFELGITVLHAFMSLIPSTQVNGVLSGSDSTGKTRDQWVSRIDALIVEVPSSAAGTQTEIIQILLSIASTPAGGHLLYENCLVTGKWTPFLSEASRHPLIVEIVSRMFVSIGNPNTEGRSIPLQDMSQQLDVLLSILMKNAHLEHDAAAPFFGKLYDLFAALPSVSSAVLESHPNLLEWLKPLIALIRASTANPRRAGRAAQQSLVNIVRLLLERCPMFGPLFFDAACISASLHLPYCFIFTTSLLIDIRSTLPSLPELHKTPAYADTSTRLAASYDLVFAHLNYLLQESDDEDEESTAPVSLPFDLILKLRDSISETMHLTTESLRERYDDCTADSSGASTIAKLKTMAEDPLTVSQIGAIGFWLQEDDSTSADDILEVILWLYACNTDLAPLCVGVLGSLCAERRDLVRRAEEVVEGMQDVDEEVRRDLGDVIAQLEEDDAVGRGEDEEDVEDDNDGYDYD